MRKGKISNHFSPASLGARVLSRKVAAARQIAKGPDLFRRRAPTDPEDTGELHVLRRWNSHTPALLDVLGGGYFIRWNNRGTIVDPGHGFIRIFHQSTLYGLRDVDMIITTHDHVDHCQDFGSLVSLLRQFNQWGLRRKESGFPKTFDIIVSHGVAAQFASLLSHPENGPFLRWGKMLAPNPVERVRMPPGIAMAGGALEDLSGWPSHLKALCTFYSQKIESEYGFRLAVLPAKHRELLGRNTSMGLRFDLLQTAATRDGTPADCCSIVISGDTGVDAQQSVERGGVTERAPTQSELSSPFKRRLDAGKLVNEFYKGGCDLLVLHVGTMETIRERTGELRREEEHLGLIGVVEILREMALAARKSRRGPAPVRARTKGPKAVVLTEWGYEFARLGLQGRTEFTKLVVEELRNNGCKKYFAAVPGEKRGRATIPIIPADVGLRIQLPQLYILSRRRNGNEEWVEPTQVCADERGPEIVYGRT